MSYVFVVDQQCRPLDPVPPGRARHLLTAGHAAVLRRYPFTIILKEAIPETPVTLLRLKVDPGSKTTGLAIVHDATGDVVWAAELTHRGGQIKKNLDKRRQYRRSRRQRHTRYRKARFANRRRSNGWLPPSLQSRVENVLTWVERIQRWCPIGAISLELVRFDLQALQHPEIRGVEYQQGTLQGYEIREYLLEKWGRQCAYCQKGNRPLQVEHIVPKSRGGTNRLSNLTLACEPCNQKKGDRTAEEFGFPQIQAQARAPLKDAAAVNSTRWALYDQLSGMGMVMETGTGGRTKWNRTTRNTPKTHWLDAANVGASTPLHLCWYRTIPLQIEAQGWQWRQMCLVTKHGFPRTKAKAASRACGFRTGDIVKATVPSGKPQGTHVDKVAIKASGNFTISTRQKVVPDVPHRCCVVLQRRDGYAYQKGERACLPTPLGGGCLVRCVYGY